MLDENGYRLNVGIILLNKQGLVFWGKRKGGNAWQFPQGGMYSGETLEEALYRELHEELGLDSQFAKIIARTKDWLFYDVPVNYSRSSNHNNGYKGQKQIWFLLEFLGQDHDINVKYHKEQEFDDWQWTDYWSTKDNVVNFKRDVYEKALTELYPHLTQYIAAKDD